MLSFEQFFSDCVGLWTTERTYHTLLEPDVERSHTAFRVDALTSVDKQKIISGLQDLEEMPGGISFSSKLLASVVGLKSSPADMPCPGFSIAFDTESERGETVAMALNALFIPDAYFSTASDEPPFPLPLAAQLDAKSDLIQGIYLRDRGYFDASAIAGWFTYQPSRQTLEMTTYYSKSVAVDQMRFVSPTLRMRTIVTYQRPDGDQSPSAIELIGFGVEHRSEGGGVDPSKAETWAQS
ncbi:MAG: phycobiliprotein lyase [Elainellaceae cyanobacterium]